MTEKTEDGAVSKTQKLVEAARARREVEQKIAEDNKTASPLDKNNLTEEEIEGKREAAREIAAVKVQARSGSLTGDIDIDAMGDVKGDGGDAKDYDDDDPAKQLGVPVYQHGLGSTKDGAPELAPAAETLFGDRKSARIDAEMNRGKEALAGVQTERDRVTTSAASNASRDPYTGEVLARDGSAHDGSRTVVTDVVEDANGDAGRARVEAAKADAAKAKAEAEDRASSKSEDEPTSTKKTTK